MALKRILVSSKGSVSPISYHPMKTLEPLQVQEYNPRSSNRLSTGEVNCNYKINQTMPFNRNITLHFDFNSVKIIVQFKHTLIIKTVISYRRITPNSIFGSIQSSSHNMTQNYIFRRDNMEIRPWWHWILFLFQKGSVIIWIESCKTYPFSR